MAHSIGTRPDTVCADLHSRRPNPADNLAEPPLTETQRRSSGELMRVNHAGEICAQALYFGQMAMARSPEVYQTLEAAAEEETDHLHGLHNVCKSCKVIVVI